MDEIPVVVKYSIKKINQNIDRAHDLLSEISCGELSPDSLPNWRAQWGGIVWEHVTLLSELRRDMEHYNVSSVTGLRCLPVDLATAVTAYLWPETAVNPKEIE